MSRLEEMGGEGDFGMHAMLGSTIQEVGRELVVGRVGSQSSPKGRNNPWESFFLQITAPIDGIRPRRCSEEEFRHNTGLRGLTIGHG